MNPPRFLKIIILLLFFIIILLPVLYIVSLPAAAIEFERIFEKRQIGLMINSLLLACGTTFFSLLIGIPSGFLLTQVSARLKTVFLICFLIPILIPTYIQAIVWNHISLYINQYFSMVNFHTIEGAIFILTLSYFSYVTMLTFSGIQSIDRNLIEIALLSSDKWTTLYKIVLPLVFPHIFASAIFVFVFSIIDFGVPDMLKVNVYPIEIFIQFSAFYDTQAAMVLSLPIILFTIAIIILQKAYMKNRSYIQIFGIQQEVAYAFSFKPYVFMILLPLIFISAILPIVVLIIKSGAFSNYVNVWLSSKSQIFYSLYISVISSVCVTCFGFLLAVMIEKSSHKVNQAIDYISMIPLAIPATTVGICMIQLWNQPYIDAVYSSSGIIILAYMLRFMPFSLLIISSGLKKINKNVEESALQIGCSWTGVILHITVPLMRPILLIAFFFVFILSFSELGTTVLLMPPGNETIPVKIYNLMHYGAYELVNALCLILLGIIISVSTFSLIIFQKVFNPIKENKYDRS